VSSCALHRQRILVCTHIYTLKGEERDNGEKRERERERERKA